jgi:pimeloyl-ACP methyl ester carboxylesterase/class 3 adenylate cyclase
MPQTPCCDRIVGAMAAETRYAKSGKVFVAYQVSGQASPDLVVVPGFFSHMEHDWENPRVARFNHALGSFSRLICFDKRGTGLSDRSVGVPHLEERIDDIRAVLDATGSERAFLCGTSEGGPMSLLFAATYPERVAGLILVGAYARAVGAVTAYDDPASAERTVEESWGTGKGLEAFAPSVAGEQAFRDWWARRQRLSASPSDVINLIRMNLELDVRHILPAIRVPTLVIHRRDDVRVRSAAGRHLAETIPNATYVELPGADHLCWIDDDGRITGAIRKFVGASPEAVETDRVLATVMFTDIVDSTRRAMASGDRIWRATLEAHDGVVRMQLQRYRGREVKTTGDGFMALFDGPARAVRCAQEIVRAVRPLDLEIRAGLHTGEVEVMGTDIGGIAVHIAARIAERAGNSEVLASSTVKDLVAGAGIGFADLGAVELKGLSEPMRLFSATG